MTVQTAFAAANTALRDTMSIEEIIEKFTAGPRKIISEKQVTIEEGEPANCSVLNPDEEWTVNDSDIKSKSKNNPFIGMKLTGKIKAVFNNGQHIIV